MRNLTRTEIARLIQGKLLNGDKLSSKQFDRVLQKHGNHERSRVLELYAVSGAYTEKAATASLREI